MEVITLKEQITQLELQETNFQVDLQTITDKLHSLRKEEKERNLPKITRSDFDKLLSHIEGSIIHNRIDVGSNCDVYYSIDDNEISADITLNDHFTREVLTNVTTTVEEGDFLAIIEDGN